MKVCYRICLLCFVYCQRCYVCRIRTRSALKLPCNIVHNSQDTWHVPLSSVVERVTSICL